MDQRFLNKSEQNIPEIEYKICFEFQKDEEAIKESARLADVYENIMEFKEEFNT